MIAWHWLIVAVVVGGMVGGVLALAFFCSCVVGKACDERCEYGPGK